MDRKAETPKPSAGIFDPVAAFKPMAPVSWMGKAWFENFADLGSEITSFVADRIKEDVKTQHEILHCKSLAELQDVQAKFM